MQFLKSDPCPCTSCKKVPCNEGCHKFNLWEERMIASDIDVAAGNIQTNNITSLKLVIGTGFRKKDYGLIRKPTKSWKCHRRAQHRTS